MTTAVLTRKSQHDDVGSEIVSALEDAWATIRTNHPQIPLVVVTLATRGRIPKHGHYVALAWQTGEVETSELFVAGESLEKGAEFVLTILLHEATHGLADARGIKDTSRQGRYHNRRYADLAEELGLAVEHNGRNHGWNGTSLRPDTAERYASTIAILAAVLDAYRRPQKTGTKGSNNGPVLECACPYKLRVSASTAQSLAGRLVCPDCATAFTVPVATTLTPTGQNETAQPDDEEPYCDRCGYRVKVCQDLGCPSCDVCDQYAADCHCGAEGKLPFCDRCGYRIDMCRDLECPPCDECGEYADDCQCHVDEDAEDDDEE